MTTAEDKARRAERAMRRERRGFIEEAAREDSKMNETAHTPGPLYVEKAGGDRQFEIKSDFYRRKGEWNDVYVSFGGHFGSYGPTMFAAAPETLNALRNLVETVDAAFPGTPWTAQARAAISKATAPTA